jgi:protein SCO1/2
VTPADAARFDATTREEDIAAWVAACPPNDAARAALTAILPEQHPIHAGRSTNETARIRGYVLAAFERIGLPCDAMPYVLDELQNGDDAYLVGAAAKALRGAAAPGDVACAVPFLATARENIRYADAPITFDVYKPQGPAGRGTTAVQEIRRTTEWLGEVDCCAAPAAPRTSRRPLALAHVALEDQDGRSARFGDFFSGKPSVVAFFYTRCDNVRKCSLTVTKLAALQREIAARNLNGRVRVSAITYDPLFDLPARMRIYGGERGVAFGDDVRFFRVPDGFEEMRAAFDLGVNYIGSIVNRHRIELYVLDRGGRIAGSFTRFTWNEQDVARQLERLLHRSALQSTARAAFAGGASLLVALLPKCPLCLGAYASALGVVGLQLAPHRAWLLPLALVFVLTHLIMLVRRATRTRHFVPVALSTAGVVALIAGAASAVPVLSFAGAALTIAGAVLNALPRAEAVSVSTASAGGEPARPRFLFQA